MDEETQIAGLIEQAEDKIGTVAVKADLLRDFLVRLNRAEEAYRRQVACLREREEARDLSRAPGGWASLDHIERTARRYAGTEFHNLEATCGILKRLFAAVRDSDFKTANRLVGHLDAGLDDRPWLKAD